MSCICKCLWILALIMSTNAVKESSVRRTMSNQKQFASNNQLTHHSTRRNIFKSKLKLWLIAVRQKYSNHTRSVEPVIKKAFQYFLSNFTPEDLRTVNSGKNQIFANTQENLTDSVSAESLTTISENDLYLQQNILLSPLSSHLKKPSLRAIVRREKPSYKSKLHNSTNEEKSSFVRGETIKKYPRKMNHLERESIELSSPWFLNLTCGRNECRYDTINDNQLDFPSNFSYLFREGWIVHNCSAGKCDDLSAQDKKFLKEYIVTIVFMTLFGGVLFIATVYFLMRKCMQNTNIGYDDIQPLLQEDELGPRHVKHQINLEGAHVNDDSAGEPAPNPCILQDSLSGNIAQSNPNLSYGGNVHLIHENGKAINGIQNFHHNEQPNFPDMSREMKKKSHSTAEEHDLYPPFQTHTVGTQTLFNTDNVGESIDFDNYVPNLDLYGHSMSDVLLGLQTFQSSFAKK